MTKNITIPVIIILAAMLTATSIYSSWLLGEVNNIELSQTDEDLGIRPLPLETNSPVSEKERLCLWWASAKYKDH